MSGFFSTQRKNINEADYTFTKDRDTLNTLTSANNAPRLRELQIAPETVTAAFYAQSEADQSYTIWVTTSARPGARTTEYTMVGGYGHG